jgi:ferredoxin
MRVEVDTTECEGYGVCEGIEPRIFLLGDREQVEIADGEVPPELRDRAEQAVMQCPKAALRVVD